MKTFIFVLLGVIATTTTPYGVEYLWTFDSNYQDLSATFDGIPINGVEFSAFTITGYGTSLSLVSAVQQAVLIEKPFIDLSDGSWTFETWIYPFILDNNADYGIIGQCESLSTDRCLHLNIRNGKLYMGFFSDDLSGVTSLAIPKWYHLAFVFDRNSLTQSIYVDGVLDGNRIASSSYLGKNGVLTVGSIFLNDSALYFNGLVDELSFNNRVKTPIEILDDATLTLYFPFDNGSLYDKSPMRINGSVFGSTNVVPGRVGDGLQIGSYADSYFRASGLVLLGTSNQSYSMSIWINPTVINRSIIIHVATKNDGLGWCIGMLGLNSSGHLIATSWDNVEISVAGPILTTNSWTHAAITYSISNGLRLYVNGTLSNSSGPFSYVASELQNYLFLGSCLNGTVCAGAAGQFVGAVDEFRLYSRELTNSDIWTLFQL